MASITRVFRSFSLAFPKDHLRCFIDWANAASSVVVYLDSCGFETDPYRGIEAVLAIGSFKEIAPADTEDAFDTLKTFTVDNKDWLFGFFSYDLKNQTEKLSSRHPDEVRMPLLHFFTPEILIFQRGDTIEIGLLQTDDNPVDHESIYSLMCSYQTDRGKREVLEIKSRVSRDDYLKNVRQIKNHIQRGDIYEVNYCIEFFSEDADIDPVSVFDQLINGSPAPFSCFYKLQNKYLLSSSPERFLAKRGEKLVSQPIKGTAPRHADPLLDQEIKEALSRDTKERSENVMIVDLVRNDLSHSARRGTVQVEELCKVYSYKHVHQMISTVSCQLRKDVDFIDAIRNAFPMGSMTGAPKIRAMEIIEEYESTRRGLYSGAVGYISPCGNFDFNVIIRSILYNLENRYVSFMAGSAVTILSDPEKEYLECLLKASSLAMVLGTSLDNT